MTVPLAIVKPREGDSFVVIGCRLWHFLVDHNYERFGGIVATPDGRTPICAVNDMDAGITTVVCQDGSAWELVFGEKEKGQEENQLYWMPLPPIPGSKADVQ